MDGNESAEFAWFQSVQDKLRDAFLKEGYDHTEAQELGFLIAQAVRDVPPLLRLLGEAEKDSHDEILDAVHMILANRSALYEAARILSLEK